MRGKHARSRPIFAQVWRALVLPTSRTPTLGGGIFIPAKSVKRAISGSATGYRDNVPGAFHKLDVASSQRQMQGSLRNPGTNFWFGRDHHPYARPCAPAETRAEV